MFYMTVYVSVACSLLVEGGRWWLGQWVDQHALNALRHSEGVLVRIHMLAPAVALHELLHTAVVEPQPLQNMVLRVTWMLGGEKGQEGGGETS